MSRTSPDAAHFRDVAHFAGYRERWRLSTFTQMPLITLFPYF